MFFTLRVLAGGIRPLMENSFFLLPPLDQIWLLYQYLEVPLRPLPVKAAESDMLLEEDIVQKWL